MEQVNGKKDLQGTGFDQRETVFERAARGELGERINKIWTKEDMPDPLSRSLFGYTYEGNCLTRVLSNFVDGPVNVKRTQVTNEVEMSTRIKEVAKALGADLVGITRLDPKYVYSHHGQGYDREKGTYGQKTLLNAKYAIVIACEQDLMKVRSSPSYIDEFEIGHIYHKVAVIVCQLAAFIREMGYEAMAHHHRRQYVMHVPLAVEAGLGELGRNGILVTPEFGPRVRLATVTTNLPLAVDSKVNIGLEAFCDICQKCVKNCPSGAIPSGHYEQVDGGKRWLINPDRCFKFWLAQPERWFGCSNCVKSCSWNKRNVFYHKWAVWMVANLPFLNRFLLLIDDIIYGKYPHWHVEWLGYQSTPLKLAQREMHKRENEKE